jgi:hypothetical protein
MTTLLALGKTVARRNILKAPIATVTSDNQRGFAFQFGSRRRRHSGEPTSD